MENDDSKYTRNLARNAVVGLITTYLATTGLCFAALGDVGKAAAIAAVPTLFAGPYVGLLITLIGAVAPRHATNDAAAATAGRVAATPAVPVVSDAAA